MRFVVFTSKKRKRRSRMEWRMRKKCYKQHTNKDQMFYLFLLFFSSCNKQQTQSQFLIRISPFLSSSYIRFKMNRFNRKIMYRKKGEHTSKCQNNWHFYFSLSLNLLLFVFIEKWMRKKLRVSLDKDTSLFMGAFYFTHHISSQVNMNLK